MPCAPATRVPYISLPNNSFGILSLFSAFPDAARPLKQLADTVLRRRNSPLTVGDRELIFAYVSARNNCQFCRDSHMAFAARHIKGGMDAVSRVVLNGSFDDISPKLASLIRIAHALNIGANNLTQNHVLSAKRFMASDEEIHDAMLVAAMAGMYNRYVDGANTELPANPAVYEKIATEINEVGYVNAG